jgi:hypothetical protein
MSKINLGISLPAHPDVRLRSVTENDLENLRNWKNANKHSFFLNQDITPEQQQQWYRNFYKRKHDHMFIVEQLVDTSWVAIGCMGFRKLDEEGCVDGYNIIRAQKLEPASFSMSEAFRAMLAYAVSVYPDWPVQVKVLTNNPAIAWYQKNSFAIIDRVDNYCLMELDKTSLSNIEWTVNKLL